MIIENIILEDGIEIKQNLTDHYTKFEPCFYRNYGKEMVLHTEILYIILINAGMYIGNPSLLLNRSRITTV